MSEQHQQIHQALRVLLSRFAEVSGATMTCVVRPTEQGASANTLLVGQNDEDGATGLESPESALVSDVMTHGRDRYEPVPRFAGGLLVVPIAIRDDRIGVLCAGFPAPLGERLAAIRWSARSYSMTMALCIDDVGGVGRLIASSTVDGLTGCHTRDVLWRTVADEVKRAQRLHQPLSCAFLDLDGFKSVNDSEGHLCGDSVLSAVATAMRSVLRGYDTIARVGGDEFVILLPGTPKFAADTLVDRVRSAISDAAGEITAVPVSASVGVAQWRPGESGASLIGRADGRLLEMKAGRHTRLDLGELSSAPTAWR